MTDIPALPPESVEQLEDSPELVKVLLGQNPQENRLIFILNKPTISTELMDLITDIGRACGISWCFIPGPQEKTITSRYQKTTYLFSKEPDSKLPKHPIL